ncbi:MAG: binding-protein-dependent transport system inner rane component [Caloramator sp.]|jgi:D-methionine transport system permease protein|uniref:methionine ABC transporter permease n=1 Tax=Caloramator sp. TaxID=1871330 RepID=UPI001DAE2E7D|nr:methionine ABC transporter permease [Caloramator sp.]MBZ4664285.1 binding-protein-dependent transport system inner rane component [Caloramator sp.]
MIEILNLVLPSFLDTLYMVVFSTLFSVLLGTPLGIFLVLTDKEGLLKMPKLNSIIGSLINITRSIPFIILIILLFPLSRVIVGTTIGKEAAVVPLSIAAAPFVARVVESALKEVNKGVIEAAVSLGASTPQIVFKVLIKEALPGLILGITLTIVNIIGYSAMAGVIGGGGIGDLAVRYGYQRFRTDILIVTVIILILLVEITQRTGNYFAKKIDRR